jgi:hemolysin III
MIEDRQLSLGEEIANSVTHGLGLVVSLIAAPVLLLAVATRGDTWQIVGCGVFAATLVALYASSTLYHALPHSRAKGVLQVIDHSLIYLLIAGTYTPFMLGVLRGAWGWSMLGVMWGLAACGVVFKTVLGMRFQRLSTMLYLVMGWLAVIAFRPLAAAIPRAGLVWLLAGGLFYTGGVVFYVWERPRYAHMVWHLFVLAGSACHYCAVFWYVVPRA